MDQSVSAEQLAQLWNEYARVSRLYQLAKRATDATEDLYQATYCGRAEEQSAYAVLEVVQAEEVRWARAVALASQAFQAATDAVFLYEIGIIPDTCGRDGVS